MKILTWAALCTGLFTAGAAVAQEGGAKGDARCVIAMMAIVKNPSFKEGATAGMFYYLGRLTGRDPGIDLTVALRREAQQLPFQEFAPEAKRCGDAMRGKNEALKIAGEALQGRATGH